MIWSYNYETFWFSNILHDLPAQTDLFSEKIWFWFWSCSKFWIQLHVVERFFYMEKIIIIFYVLYFFILVFTFALVSTVTRNTSPKINDSNISFPPFLPHCSIQLEMDWGVSPPDKKVALTDISPLTKPKVPGIWQACISLRNAVKIFFLTRWYWFITPYALKMAPKLTAEIFLKAARSGASSCGKMSSCLKQESQITPSICVCLIIKKKRYICLQICSSPLTKPSGIFYVFGNPLEAQNLVYFVG